MQINSIGSPFPNFNFNVSHHGDYVGIASDPVCLVGLDIVSIMIPERTTEHEFMSNFSSFLTALEWKNIAKTGASEEKLCEFYRYEHWYDSVKITQQERNLYTNKPLLVDTFIWFQGFGCTGPSVKCSIHLWNLLWESSNTYYYSDIMFRWLVMINFTNSYRVSLM